MSSSKPSKFRKKPVVIDAVQWNGNMTSVEDIMFSSTCNAVHQELGDNGLTIETLEGNMRAEVGDWIIQGVKGELYSVKDEIFKLTYEPA